jgi:hypothetical protein
MTHHFRTWLAVVSSVLFLGGTFGAPAKADAQSRVISVEEHWELQVGQPDTDRSAPQTTMVMSPTGDVMGTHFLFTLNHMTVPDYQPGGMQIQLWNGEELVDQKAGHDSAALEHSDETVHWTQQISLQGGKLRFKVFDGESETWSTFGGEEFSVNVDSSLTSLNGYRPSVSLGESQVGYAENRVVSLTLTKIVWVTDDGQVHEQNAPIPIDLSLGD